MAHVRSALSAPVEQEKPDTARRASGDSTPPGQINQTAHSLTAEELQLSSRRTGSESPAFLGRRQRPSGAVRAPFGHFSPVSDGVTGPGSVGPDSSRAPGAQCPQNSTPQAPQTSSTARHRRLLHQTHARTNASVEATLFGAAFGKAPSLLARLPTSHRT